MELVSQRKRPGHDLLVHPEGERRSGVGSTGWGTLWTPENLIARLVAGPTDI